MVAAVAVNRAVTNECWAACTPGYVCDHESGLCVQGECVPRCSDEQVCARLDQKLTCVHKGFLYNRNVRGAGPVVSPGAAPDPHPEPPTHRSAPPAPAVPIPLALSEHSDDTSAPAPQPTGKQAHCPRPGSAAWYAELDAKTTAPEPVPQRRADFVGLWQPSARPAGALLLVTKDWLGSSKLTAADYRVVQSSSSALHIATTVNAVARRDTVRFVTRDEISFRGASYQRVDCASSVMPAACCELPRERWVRLAPEPLTR